jgi:hyperosmotically inducible periplasmic protein
MSRRTPVLDRTLRISFIAATLGFAAMAAANAPMDADRSPGQVLDDTAITASVKAKLLDDTRTEGFDINVDTAKGRVILRGGADTAADRMAAGDIARGTDGVLSVDNRIVVAAAGSEARQAANQATASGDVREAAEEAGDEMSDAWITSKVKTALVADDDIAGMAIRVETEDKAVRLAGDVPNATLRAEAIRIAEATEGVLTVDASDLNVRPALQPKPQR